MKRGEKDAVTANRQSRGRKAQRDVRTPKAFGESRRKRIISLHESIVGIIVSRAQTGTPGDLHGSGTSVLISIPLPSRSLSLSKDGLGYQSLKLNFISLPFIFSIPFHSTHGHAAFTRNGRQADRAGEIQGRTLVALRRRDMRLESIDQNTRR